MSRLARSTSQRQTARCDAHASRLKATITRGGSLRVGAANATLYNPASAAIRAKQHISVRLGSTASSSKDVSKSTTILQASNRSKADPSSKKVRKVPTEAEVFFTNLLLLGFNPEVVSAKNQGTSIPFDKDMFAVPNMLAFQVVMHFLLTKLDAVKFQEEFRDCWPICDRKQEQIFRKVCLAWLTEISEDRDAHLPRLVPSLFLSPGGARFYQLMMSLTTYILTKSISAGRSPKVQYPLLTHKNNQFSDLIARSMKELIARRRNEFFNIVQQNVIVNKECELFANDLVAEHRSLNDEIREKERILRQLKSELSRGTPLSPRGLDSISAAREENIKSVRKEWNALGKYYVNTGKERDVLNSIVKGTIDKHRLLASDYNVQVPDLLLRTRNEEILRRNISNTIEGGRLDLISVLKLWTLSMDVCYSEARNSRQPKLSDFAPNLLHHVHDLTSYLANLRSLKNKIQELDLPEVRKSIDSLKGELDLKDPVKFWHNSQDNIGFIPATPPISMEPGLGEDLTSVLPHLKGKTPLSCSTPEAAERIIHSAQKRAKKKVEYVETVTKLPTRLEHEAVEGRREFNDLTAVRRLRPQPSPRVVKTVGVTNPADRSSAKKSAGKSREEAPKREGKMPTLKSGLVTKRIELLHSENAAREIIRKSGTKLSTRTAEGMTSLPFKELSGKLDEKRVVSKELFTPSPPPKSSRDRAEEALIDQIVDAVTWGTPRERTTVSAESTPGYDINDVNLLDPLSGLDDTAFMKRDKIAHSPVSSSPAFTRANRSVTFSPRGQIQLEDSLDEDLSDFFFGNPGSDENGGSDVRKKNPYNEFIDIGSSTVDLVETSIIDVIRRSPYTNVTRKSPYGEVSGRSSCNRAISAKSPKADVIRHESPFSRSPAPRIFLSPLPEFDAPIEIPSFGSGEVSAVQVHEPSPARLESLMASMRKMPLTSSMPVLDLRTVSPTEDVMDASLDLVALSSESGSDSESAVPTGDLIEFESLEPTSGPLIENIANESLLVIGRLSPGSSPTPERKDYHRFDQVTEDNVLNSDERIQFLHQFEKSFEEEMLNLSLKAAGTAVYARHEGVDDRDVCKTSLLDLNDEDDVTMGKPRTPIGSERQSPMETVTSLTTPTGVKFAISPQFTVEDDTPPQYQPNLAAGDASSRTFSAVKNARFDGAFPTSNYDNTNDILSRFRSLKLRSTTLPMESTRRVLSSPEKNIDLDVIDQIKCPENYAENVGKFALDLLFDDLVEQKELINNDDNNNWNSPEDRTVNIGNGNTDFSFDDDSEIVLRSPGRVVQSLKTRAVLNDKNGGNSRLGDITLDVKNESGLLDLAADDLLVPSSPGDGADMLL